MYTICFHFCEHAKQRNIKCRNYVSADRKAMKLHRLGAYSVSIFSSSGQLVGFYN